MSKYSTAGLETGNLKEVWGLCISLVSFLSKQIKRKENP